MRYHIELISLCLLFGCSNNAVIEVPKDHDEKFRRSFGSFIGDDTLVFSMVPKQSSSKISSNVNPFIWKASLDCISFMPLLSSDALGGVIITDWYTPSNKPFEKIKVTIYILSKNLSSESLKVVIHKQSKGINFEVDPSIITDLKCLILSKAKELYLQTKQN